MNFLPKSVLILILLTTTVISFEVIEIFEREDGDSLIYTHTKETIPTAEYSEHMLYYEWTSTETWFTKVIIEMNSFSVAMFDWGNRTHFIVEVEDFNTRQLIVTVLAYGFKISEVAPPVDSKMGSKQYYNKEIN